ncbi:MAG: repair protein recN [Bacteroidetes bacterium]|nr:repair protein recN [Bacteroidota bacterium]
MDIHAQHQHLLLADSNFQLTVLDSFAENRVLLENYRVEFEEVNRLNKKLHELKEQIAKEEAEQDYNSFQYNQLEDAKLSEGELEEIEGEFRLLSNAEEIKVSLYNMASLLNPSDISVVHNLREMTSIASRISGNYPAVNSISERIESCRIELKDIEEEIQASAEKVTLSPERAQQLDERISLIYTLLKKHNAENTEELISIRNSLAEKLKLTEDRKEEITALKNQIEKVTGKRDNMAEELYRIRVGIAKKFDSTLLSKIRELEMPHAMFETRVEKISGFNLNGNCSVKFFFSANKNGELRDISKVASGGELSRIMLCLKSVMASGLGMPTMIFDEIDTGVSGKIADKMGNLIGEMAKNMQIFAITHLPQIASKGECHLLVYKEIDDKNTTRTEIRRISGEERLIEIARMLSGAKLTEAAVANAKELLYNQT